MNVPDYREDDEEPGRERFYRRDLDPRRWLMERDGELRITWPDGPSATTILPRFSLGPPNRAAFSRRAAPRAADVAKEGSRCGGPQGRTVEGVEMRTFGEYEDALTERSQTCSGVGAVIRPCAAAMAPAFGRRDERHVTVRRVFREGGEA